MSYYQKDFKSFSEQIDLLESRGIVFNKINKKIAEEKISNINYYKLSGYFKNFESSVDKYSNVEFKEILDLYYFDRELANLLFKLIEKIEISFKTTLAYEISKYIKDHTPGEELKTFKYLRIQNWMDKTKIRNPKDKLKKELEFKNTVTSYTARNISENIQNYFSKYSNEHFIPIWMLIEVIDFGGAYKMYDNSNNDIKKEISKKYSLTKDDFAFYLRSLKFIRNCIAHNGIIWNISLLNVINKPIISKHKDINPKRIMSVIVVITEIMKFIDKNYDYKILKNCLKEFFDKYPCFLSKFGIKNNNTSLIDDILK